jgi:hypothetical protein
MLLAGAAQVSKDSAARNAAVRRASTARQFNPRFPSFFALLQSPDIRAEPPQNRSALADILTGMEQTLPMLSYTPFLQFCADPSVPKADRISVCSNLANLLLKRDRTLLGLAMGLHLGQLAGWVPDVLNALRDEKNALSRATPWAPTEVATDCEDLARFEQWAADYAALGQLGAIRKSMAEASETPRQSTSESGDKQSARK